MFIAAFVRQQAQLAEIAASGTSPLERAWATQSLKNRMTLHAPQTPEGTGDYRAAGAAFRDVSDEALAEIRKAAEGRAGRSVSLTELQVLQQTLGQLRPGRGSEPLVVASRAPEASAVASRSPPRPHFLRRGAMTETLEAPSPLRPDPRRGRFPSLLGLRARDRWKALRL